MTEHEEHWGPWTIHDGSGCPCVGMWVRVETDRPVYRDGLPPEAVIYNDFSFAYMPLDNTGDGWWWMGQFEQIVRYQVRTPRALIALQRLARTVDAHQYGQD